ncbi:hypothetical protein V8G54_026701 [Vigna mungo]
MMSTRTSPWIMATTLFSSPNPTATVSFSLSLSFSDSPNKTTQHKTHFSSLSRLYLHLTPDTVSEPDKSKATSASSLRSSHLSLSPAQWLFPMACRELVVGNLDPQRKRSGGLRTKQAGRGSCRGS